MMISMVIVDYLLCGMCRLVDSVIDMRIVSVMCVVWISFVCW